MTIHTVGEPCSCIGLCSVKLYLIFIDYNLPGLLKSTLDCPKCNQTVTKYDPMMYLSVPIPGTQTVEGEWNLRNLCRD